MEAPCPPCRQVGGRGGAGPRRGRSADLPTSPGRSCLQGILQGLTFDLRSLASRIDGSNDVASLGVTPRK